MKRVVLWLFWLLMMPRMEAQEVGFRSSETDSLRPMEWHIRYDSLHACHAPMLATPPSRPLIGNLSVQPIVPGSSVVRIDFRGLPTRIYVLNNIVLQIGGYVNLTNGEAWIFGPYPAGFQDARTLSVPLSR